jgi:hypothetical protein
LAFIFIAGAIDRLQYDDVQAGIRGAMIPSCPMQSLNCMFNVHSNAGDESQDVPPGLSKNSTTVDDAYGALPYLFITLLIFMSLKICVSMIYISSLSG